MRKRAAIGIVALAVLVALYLVARPRGTSDERVEGSGVMEATEVEGN